MRPAFQSLRHALSWAQLLFSLLSTLSTTAQGAVVAASSLAFVAYAAGVLRRPPRSN
jgi:hypothetical protein